MSHDLVGGSRFRRRGCILVTTALLATAVVAAQPAEAWKPYTHVFTGDNAYNDAVDGDVTINGVEYPLNPRCGGLVLYQTAGQNTDPNATIDDRQSRVSLIAHTVVVDADVLQLVRPNVGRP